MVYLVELQKPASAPAYVVQEADCQDAARAVIDARLHHEEVYDDVRIVAVHTVH